MFAVLIAITDKGVELLGSSIGRHLTQLQQLTLNFYRVTQSKNDFGGSIKTNLPFHFGFILIFAVVRQITDKGVELLGSSIGRYLTQLQQFTLDFGQ